jgi:hypothetical protein
VGAVVENPGAKSGEYRPETCLTEFGDIPDSSSRLSGQTDGVLKAPKGVGRRPAELVKLDLAWLCSTLSKLELEGLRYRSAG